MTPRGNKTDKTKRKKYTHTPEGLARKVASRNKFKGANHPSWKGGKIIVDGYIYIYSPNHPNKTKNKYVCEHRLVMEKKLGRYLEKNEVVHHINHNKIDNRLSNLRLFTSSGKHSSFEHITRDLTNGRFLKAEV